MCGRYTLTTPIEGIRQAFEVMSSLNLAARYNIAPTQDVPVIRRRKSGQKSDGEKELAMLHWGLIPSWSKDAGSAARLINGRSETLSEKPSFRRAFAQRRCLLPADGFYEWKTVDGAKQPYYITRADGEVFAFAGLWESWQDPASQKIVESCCIITTAAHPSIAEIHHRMPVILPHAAEGLWLDPKAGQQDLQDLLLPFDDAPISSRPVSRRVNKVVNDDAGLLSVVDPSEFVEVSEKKAKAATSKVDPSQGELF